MSLSQADKDDLLNESTPGSFTVKEELSIDGMSPFNVTAAATGIAFDPYMHMKPTPSPSLHLSNKPSFTHLHNQSFPYIKALIQQASTFTYNHRISCLNFTTP